MKRIIALLGIAMAASTAMSQVWSQPWTRPLPAWMSVVRSCDNPKPFKLAAFDDFRTDDVRISTIVYWGTVRDLAQLGRPMYYAVYKDNGNCQPAIDSLVWKDCLKPDWEFVDCDCQGQLVFRFKQALSPLNILRLSSGHYWIEIAEDDSNSANPGAPEFAWSSHQSVNLCPALQWDWNGNFIQPLQDPCNGAKDDLAFELY
ncbi:MAG: hypothetical protein KF784_10540 [Fimbriimonadaceae bacterium]|nr:hypothetical protein [Fimbriimonadaceae bacterium]